MKNSNKGFVMRTWLKILISVVVIIGLAGAGAYQGFQSYMNHRLNQVKRVKVDKSKLSCVDVNGYVNIALLGVDSRSMSKKALKNANTDAIIIVSLNSKTNEVSLTSVYRDTYLRLQGPGGQYYGKINGALAAGGIEGSLKSLNEAMGLDIDQYVLFNFKMVAQLVDAVGGIEVNVHDYEIQQLNKYTIQTARNIHQKDYKLVKKAGKQTLQGVQAVSYGRIRKGVGDDFKRTSRMRVVIKKVTAKLKNLSISQMSDIMDVCLKQCQTNMSNKDMMAMAYRVPKMEFKKSSGFPYYFTGATLQGASSILPVNWEKNVKKFHKRVFGQEDYECPSSVIEIGNYLAAVTPDSGTQTYAPATAPAGSTSGYSRPAGGTSTSGTTGGSAASSGNAGRSAAPAGNTGSGSASTGTSSGSTGSGASGNGGTSSGSAGTSGGAGTSGSASAGSGQSSSGSSPAPEGGVG